MQELKFIKLTKCFLENPYREFYLRELAKKLKISTFATKKYCEFLLKNDLILEERKANLRYFKANLNNLIFRYFKISLNISLLMKTNLIEFLKENIPNISSIILFGSMAKGENDEKSDIDILVIGKEKYLNLNKFEEKLNRNITVHMYKWGDWNKKAKEDNPFYFEVISYGINLFGEMPLVKWK